MYMLLTRHECEALAKFEKKLFKITDDCLFQFRLSKRRIGSKPEKFTYDRVLDKLGWIRRL